MFYKNVIRLIDRKWYFLFLASLLLTACASQPVVNTYGSPGFFAGLFHGFFILVAFVGSLLVDDVSIYAFPNSGGWYDLGFLIGMAVFDAIFGEVSSKSG